MSVLTEARYQANRWSELGTGKALNGAVTGTASSLNASAAEALTHATSHVVSEGAIATSSSLNGLFHGLFQGMIGVLGVGLGAILQHRIVMKDYQRDQERLAEQYAPEIAAALGLDSPGLVNVERLQEAAKRNPTLAEALKTNESKVRQRMGTWIACATIAMAVTFTALTILFPVAGLFGFACKVAASFVAFHLSQPLVEKGVEKVMELGGPSLQDRIQNLQQQRGQGKPLSPAQVLAAFVEGNPNLAEEIQSRTGKSYEQLLAAGDSAALSSLVQSYDARFHLYETTSQLNSGAMRITELAWLAHGQHSGIALHDPSDTALNRARQTLGHATEIVKEKTAQAAQTVREKTAAAAAHIQEKTHAAMQSARGLLNKHGATEAQEVSDSPAAEPTQSFVEKHAPERLLNASASAPSFTEQLQASIKPPIPGLVTR